MNLKNENFNFHSDIYLFLKQSNLIHLNTIRLENDVFAVKCFPQDFNIQYRNVS